MLNPFGNRNSEVDVDNAYNAYDLIFKLDKKDEVTRLKALDTILKHVTIGIEHAKLLLEKMLKVRGNTTCGTLINDIIYKMISTCGPFELEVYFKEFNMNLLDVIAKLDVVNKNILKFVVTRKVNENIFEIKTKSDLKLLWMMLKYKWRMVNDNKLNEKLSNVNFKTNNNNLNNTNLISVKFEIQITEPETVLDSTITENILQVLKDKCAFFEYLSSLICKSNLSNKVLLMLKYNLTTRENILHEIYKHNKIFDKDTFDLIKRCYRKEEYFTKIKMSFDQIKQLEIKDKKVIDQLIINNFDKYFYSTPEIFEYSFIDSVDIYDVIYVIEKCVEKMIRTKTFLIRSFDCTDEKMKELFEKVQPKTKMFLLRCFYEIKKEDKIFKDIKISKEEIIEYFEYAQYFISYDKLIETLKETTNHKLNVTSVFNKKELILRDIEILSKFNLDISFINCTSIDIAQKVIDCVSVKDDIKIYYVSDYIQMAHVEYLIRNNLINKDNFNMNIKSYSSDILLILIEKRLLKYAIMYNTNKSMQKYLITYLDSQLVVNSNNIYYLISDCLINTNNSNVFEFNSDVDYVFNTLKECKVLNNYQSVCKIINNIELSEKEEKDILECTDEIFINSKVYKNINRYNSCNYEDIEIYDVNNTKTFDVKLFDFGVRNGLLTYEQINSTLLSNKIMSNLSNKSIIALTNHITSMNILEVLELMENDQLLHMKHTRESRMNSYLNIIEHMSNVIVKIIRDNYSFMCNTEDENTLNGENNLNFDFLLDFMDGYNKVYLILLIPALIKLKNISLVCFIEDNLDKTIVSNFADICTAQEKINFAYVFPRTFRSILKSLYKNINIDVMEVFHSYIVRNVMPEGSRRQVIRSADSLTFTYTYEYDSVQSYIEMVVYSDITKVPKIVTTDKNLLRYNILLNKTYFIHELFNVWKCNLDKKLEGSLECLICFYILEPDLKTMAEFKCMRCSSMFHNACIYKWIQESKTDICPMCRNVLE